MQNCLNLSGDTIAAISTPYGQSGIGIVRMSGREAIPIAEAVFFSHRKIDISAMESHTLRYGFIRNEEAETIDEVLVTVMRGPSTYTREDIVEINAHGGVASLREILRILIRKGARLAMPGEFTRRAFLNGRIDLAQAESVADFIRAKTLKQAKISMKQLEGVLSREIFKIRDALLEISAEIEASIDFPEEDIDVESGDGLIERLKRVISDIENFLSQVEMGRMLIEGFKVVIAGRPNVGKSSLLNTLLSKERAIVTPIPGTTRDTIEGEIQLDGNLVRLIDTAGLSQPKDIIEEEGMRKTREGIEEANLVIFLLDANMGITGEDRDIFSTLDGKRVILAVNKIDLPAEIKEGDISRHFPGIPSIAISATKRMNIDGLTCMMKKLIWDGADVSEPLIVSLRHEEILKKVKERVADAIRGIEGNMGEEIVSIEIREAISRLGEITGEVYTEDILDRIFSKFCIGK